MKCPGMSQLEIPGKMGGTTPHLSQQAPEEVEGRIQLKEKLELLGQGELVVE